MRSCQRQIRDHLINSTSAIVTTPRRVSHFMMAMQDQQRRERGGSDSRPAFKRSVSVDPPRRRLWVLVVSAAAVLAWTLFLVWMAWQS